MSKDAFYSIWTLSIIFEEQLILMTQWQRVLEMFFLDANSLNNVQDQRVRNVKCPEILRHLIEIIDVAPNQEST